MAARLLTCCLIFFILFSGCNPKQPDFISQECKFKIQFPSPPEAETVEDVKSFKVKWSGIGFVVSANTKPAWEHVSEEEKQATIDVFKKKFIKEWEDLGEVGSSEIKLDGKHPGVEVWVESNFEKFWIERLIFGNGRQYHLVVVCHKKYFDHARVINTFFDSFQILP